MNERIKELYEQAHVIYEIPYESSVVDSTIVSTHKHRQFDPEKFAELIVRECMEQCAYTPDSGEDWDKGVKWAYNQIKEHFGVEE